MNLILYCSLFNLKLLNTELNIVGFLFITRPTTLFRCATYETFIMSYNKNLYLGLKIKPKMSILENII